MSTLQQHLDRLGQWLEEQEIAAAVERAQRHCELHGLPFSAETRAGVEAFQRHKRTWPTDLDMGQSRGRLLQLLGNGLRAGFVSRSRSSASHGRLTSLRIAGSPVS